MSNSKFSDEINVAEALRDIAANSDKTSGKIIKKAQKAAEDGETYIVVDIKEDHYNYMCNKKDNEKPLAFVERLKSLGFSLEIFWKWSTWNPVQKNYYMRVSW